jgi:hypothetical protein
MNDTVAGGFVVMNPDNTLNINAVEACALENVDKNVRCLLCAPVTSRTLG